MGLRIKDLDAITDNYDVWDIDRGYIGHKRTRFGEKTPRYEKPDRPGLRWDQREYKKTPPWFECEILEIRGNGFLTFRVKK